MIPQSLESTNHSTHPSHYDLYSSLRLQNREGETHRNIIRLNRDSLRPIEHTINFLREQIRLHDERVELSVSLLSPYSDRPSRAQLTAFQRSISSQIDTRQEDLRRQRLIDELNDNLVDFIRQSMAGRSLEGNNSLNDSLLSSSLGPSEHRTFNTNGCPIPNSTHPIHASSVFSMQIRQRENVLNCLSAPGRCSNQDENDYTDYTTLLENEWERQLANGEVDTNGTPILNVNQRNHSFNTLQFILTHSSPSTLITSTHLGTRRVDGLGLQLASISSNSKSSHSYHPSFNPSCLR